MLEAYPRRLVIFFTVSGVTKPNADIQAITSPLHLKSEKLTKKDPTVELRTSAGMK